MQDAENMKPKLPANTGKAQRGYALAKDALNKPARACPPKLRAGLALHEAAGRVLREMFGQFTSNLQALRTSDSPELVHQARIGWRRFKSALRLFRPVLATQTPPPWQALHALTTALGELRDLDVALHDTLPPLLDAYAEGDSQRAQVFQATIQNLGTAADRQRQAVRSALQMPATDAALRASTQWLAGLAASKPPGRAAKKTPRPLQAWARQRISHLRERLKDATRNAHSPQSQHRARIVAKRLRYGIEALRPLLWKRRAQRWHQQATALQTRIGNTRDIAQAAALLAKLASNPGLVEFLRGLALGREASSIPVL